MSTKHHFEPTLMIGLYLPACNNIAMNTDNRFEKETIT